MAKSSRLAKVLIPILPELRHSDCFLMCMEKENTGLGCAGECSHLSRKTPKKHSRDDITHSEGKT